MKTDLLSGRNLKVCIFKKQSNKREILKNVFQTIFPFLS